MANIETDRLLEILRLHSPQPYSGRGMYGRACWAIVTDLSEREAFADLAEECEDAAEVSALLRGARTDDMGRGIVIYWPKCAASDEEE
jgi:hypothetical protein